MSLFLRNGRWTAIIYVAGKQRWIATGTTSKKKAQQIHDSLVVKNNKNELFIPPPITFREFSELWMRDYCEVALKPVTIYEYKGTLRKYLTPAFGHMKLTAIRHEHVQRHVANLVRAGRLSPKSIKNQITPLSRLFTMAIQWGYMTNNPATRVALPRQTHTEVAFLSPDQIRQLLNEVPTEWKALIALGAMCGMRKGEVMGLTHDSILWAEKKIRIDKSMWNGKLQEPKTKRSAAKVPLTPTVEAMLMDRQLVCPASEMNLVFCRADGSPLLQDWVNRGVLEPALKRAGLPRITYHGLRHSFVAGLISQNVPIKVIQELARHASIQTTLDKYGHILPDSKEDAVGLLERAVWGVGES